MIIVNENIDIANKYRAWVELPDKSIIILKFQTQPKTDQEVFNAADAYIAQKIISDAKAKDERLEEIDKEISDLNDEKDQLSATEK